MVGSTNAEAGRRRPRVVGRAARVDYVGPEGRERRWRRGQAPQARGDAGTRGER